MKQQSRGGGAGFTSYLGFLNQGLYISSACLITAAGVYARLNKKRELELKGGGPMLPTVDLTYVATGAAADADALDGLFD
jgi:hypothetical protein